MAQFAKHLSGFSGQMQFDLSSSVESVSMERWGQSDPEMHVILSSSSRALGPRSQPLGFSAVRRRWTRLDRPRRSRVVAMVAVL